MAKDTITLTLDGDVPLPLYAKVVEHFNALVESLSEEVVGADKIEWEVFRLQAGSATTAIRGLYEEEDEVEKVVEAYTTVGKSLEAHRPIPYSETVSRHAQALVSVLNGHIKAIKFETDDYVAEVTEPTSQEEQAKYYFLGVVTGVVNALWSSPLKIAIGDALFNRVVYCYLNADQQEQARQVWGKRVSITGLIFRDPDTGRPVDVRQVKSIVPVEDVPPRSYKLAKGMLEWHEGDEPSEATIRRMRDAS